jgi:hypothetical protein
VTQVYDEEYIEYLENGRQKYIETYPFKPNKNGMAGKYSEPTEGIHYEIYWLLPDGTELKMQAMKAMRNRIMKTIEETGREYYMVWRDDGDSCFMYAMREDLYPIKVQ